MADAQAASSERFEQDAGIAGVTRIRVPASSMGPQAVRQPVSPVRRAREIRVEFASAEATVGDLVQALTAAEMQIAFRWQSSKEEEVLKRRLPFTRYSGTVGGLLDALRTGIGLVAWEERNMVFLSDADRYSVALPQDPDVIKDIAATVKELGALDVVTSLDAGKVVYTATPGLQDEVIGPFLDRTVRNLATISLQVAVVSLALNDKSSQGFDWSEFSAVVDGRQSTLNPRPQTAPQPGEIPRETPEGVDIGTIAGLASGTLSLGTTNLGTVFGAKVVSSVTGAIGFLSTFGNTNVTQNVDLRTLSGREVKFRSGQVIPYVKDITRSSGGTDTQLGTANTDTIETGLTVEMTPRFDSDAEVVTVAVKMELKSVIEFVELSAGNQIGSLTQPRTQEQELTDIVRMRAGQTVVIGGLQYDQEQYTGNEPTLLRERMRQSNTSFGKRERDVTRSALFIIMRPSVTIYEPDGVGSSLEAAIAGGLVK